LCIEKLENVGGVVAQIYFTTNSSLLSYVLAWRFLSYRMCCIFIEDPRLLG